MARAITLFTLFAVGLFANDSIEVYSKNIDIIKSGYYKTKDKTNPDEILKLFKDNKFIPFSKKAKSISFSTHEVWYGFEIKTFSLNEPLYLNIKDPTKERAYLYVFKNGKLIQSSQDGYIVPLEHKDIKTFGATFKLLTNTHAIYLIKTTSSHPHYNSFAFGTKEDIAKYWDIYFTISILVSGIFMALIFYNLFLYFMIKDRAYIFYIVYTSGLFITNGLLYGYLQLILPEHLDLTTLFLALSIQLGITGLVFFTEYFLDMDMANDKKLILINRTLLLSTIISMFLIPMANGFQPVAIFSLQALNVALLFTGYKKYKSGNTPALFYLLATGVGLICMIIFSLMSQGVIFNYNLLTFHISSVGLVWDMIVLSLALGYKTKLITEENQKHKEMLSDYSKLTYMGETMVSIYHQWKSPVNNIYNYITHIETAKEFQDKNIDKIIDSNLEKIKQNTLYLRDTASEFLKMSTAQSHTKEKINLKDEITSVLKLMDGDFNKNRIKIIDNYKQNIYLMTHKNQLRNLLMILVENAIKTFRNRGIKNPVLTITTTKDEKSVTILVEDNAGGIAEKPIDKIFERHHSASDSSGIGLYLAKYVLMEHLDGDISVANTPNGARFIVEVKKLY
jgi:signal transduction histidine kinase